jgi:hypothetical protein
VGVAGRSKADDSLAEERGLDAGVERAFQVVSLRGWLFGYRPEPSRLEVMRQLWKLPVIRPVKPPINLLVYRSQKSVWRKERAA